MALQVWLPLNGDLENKGLSSVTVTNSGATVNDNGKIGKCYSFGDGTSTTQSKGVNINSNLLYLGANRSICAWVRPKGNHLHYAGAIVSSGDWNATRWSFGVKQNNSGFTGFDAGYDSYYTTDIPVNQWTHLCATVEGNVTKFYKNGIYLGQQSRGSTFNSNAQNTMVGRETYASGYFSFNGDINDVRIYDHCLSPKEVKEIAKGLVLHYKLDDPYVEPTVNLASYSTNYSNKTYGVPFNLSGWGGDAGTCTCYASGGYNNGPYKVYHKTATGTGGVYAKMANDINIVAGRTYTMSVYVKSNRDYTDSSYSFNINGVTASDSNHYITASSGVHFTKDWTRIVRTFTASASDEGTYGEMGIIYNDDVTDYYVYYSCFQIEENDHATPYTETYRTDPGNLYYKKTNMNWSAGVWRRSAYDAPNPSIDSDGNIVLYGQGTSGNHQSFIVHSSNLVDILPNTQYTISVITKPSHTTSTFRIYFYETDINGTRIRANMQLFTPTSSEIGTWVKRSYTITTQSNTRKMYAELNCYNNPADTTVTLQNNSIILKQDGINNYVYDCSGYERNGKLSGQSISINNISPRYNYNLLAANTSNWSVITNSGFSLPDGPTTICFWSKPTISATENTSRVQIDFGYFQYFTYVNYPYLIHNTDYKYKYVNYWSDGNWHFVTGVYDGTNLSLYIDGVNISPSVTTTTRSYQNNLTINLIGNNLSDFRIYATALSEADIKELYDTSAIVDNNGDILGFEFDEEEIDEGQILKTGIIKINDFIEVNDCIYLPAGTWIDTGLNYANNDTCKAETIIRYESGGSGRDLMGYSSTGSGYWGVTASGYWEPHGTTFAYTDSDITKKNTIVYIFSSASEHGTYRVGALGSSYSVRGKYIYRVRLYKNNVLERDLYPIKIGDKVGLFDIVNNEYYLANNTNGILKNDDIIEASIFKNKVESNQLLEI